MVVCFLVFDGEPSGLFVCVCFLVALHVYIDDTTQNIELVLYRPYPDTEVLIITIDTVRLKTRCA